MDKKIKLKLKFITGLLCFFYFLLPLLQNIYKNNYFYWTIDLYYFFLIPMLTLSSMIVFGESIFIYIVYILFFLLHWFILYYLFSFFYKLFNN